MPAPLANRFIHLEASTNLDEFKTYALERKIDDKIISFLNYRPQLLHKVDKNSPAWPSPRSWEIANKLLGGDLDIDPAVGKGAAGEFRSFVKVYKSLPDISKILSGKLNPKFPEDLSARYALTCALAVRAKDIKEVKNAFMYLEEKANLEWLTQCAYDLTTIWKESKNINELVDLIAGNDQLLSVAKRIQKLMAA